MISAFGPRATAYAQLLGDMDAVVCDEHTLLEGYCEAIRRRETGEPFYGMLLADEPRVNFGYKFGEQMLAPIADFDQRRVVTEQLARGILPINGKRADEFWAMPPIVAQIIVEYLSLCDVLLVRSYAEYGRLARLFATNVLRKQMRPFERVLPIVTVPEVTRVRPKRPGVVVWAPHRPAAELALIMNGLFEFHGDLTCVCAGGPPPTWNSATFLEPGDPLVLEALASATAVLCAEPGDPSDAVAFARLGYGVVAPSTSGAHEFAGDIVPWDGLDAKFIYSTVAVAVARPAHVRVEPARPPRAPSPPPRPAYVTELPLVSVITPTFNRRERLQKMLTCLAAQTYPNLESIVVNDGGEAVDDIVAQFPFARLIDQKVNVGAVKVCQVGREHVRGEFVALLADDDWLYPDHFERLMNGIFRSGCSIAHSSALLRFLETDVGGVEHTVGYNATTFSQTLAPAQSLVTATLGGFQMVVKNSVYDECGWYIADLAIADNEIHARFCQRYFYAFADHITAECRDHAKVLSRALDFPAAMKRMYTELHPISGRPILESNREATLLNVASRPPGLPPFAKTVTLSKPE